MCSDSSDDTLRGCELLCQNDVTNATFKPLRMRHCTFQGRDRLQKVRVEFSLEGMDTSGLQKGATYPEIKARVLEQTGLKVSSLYISQVKQKCGLEVRENHHKAKSENAKQPQCPPEKEAAIRDALKYFKML